MFPRTTSARFAAKKGEKNRRALRRLVKKGPPPGLLAYAGKEPVGWCALAPRQDYVRLRTSRVLAPVDDAPVWSLVCFFVRRTHRKQGVTRALIDAAVKHASKHGARIVEAYPLDPANSDVPPAFAWWGLQPAFTKAGFSEVARRSRTRPIVRRQVRSA